MITTWLNLLQNRWHNLTGIFTIDIVKKIADVLDTTVGYLLGETQENDILKDRDMLKRFNDIAAFSEEEKNNIMWTIDAMINSVKLKSLTHR